MRAKKSSGGKKLEVDSLHDAVRMGDLGKIRAFLIADPDLVSSKDETGRTPLHWAATMMYWVAKEDRQNVVKFLLTRRRIDVNAKSDDGATPLHDAVGNGQNQMVELLLAHNADVNAKDNEGWTPFGMACFKVDWDLVELLREHGGQK
jgi:ankyrin repeat protein